MLYNINSAGLDVLLWLSACVYVCMRVSWLFPWKSFTKLFILVSLFSPLATPPCITALRLLRSLFLCFLIDMQQPTSLNCVFYAPWFSALSSSLVFPFLGWINDVSTASHFLDKSEFPFHSHIYDCEGLQNSQHHMCSAWMYAGVDIIHCHICIPSLFLNLFPTILKRIAIPQAHLSEREFPVKTCKYFINRRNW